MGVGVEGLGRHRCYPDALGRIGFDGMEDSSDVTSGRKKIYVDVDNFVEKVSRNILAW